MAKSFEILKTLARSLFFKSEHGGKLGDSRRLTDVQTQPVIESEFQDTKDYEVRPHLKNKKTMQKNVCLMRTQKC